VVNIYTTTTARVQRRLPFPFPGMPLPPQAGERVQNSLGSGVIVRPDGLIVTNAHVVKGAEEIRVVLADRRELEAKLLTQDERYDLALLRIDANGEKFPFLEMRDSDSVEVGDIVLAIGNPFNVGQTVTSGIVSALGRNQLGINTFENFIQTDAAINPGNSGGALVDPQGNLLGINTAIYSRSGGSLGIGFAIPVSTARQVMEGLIKDGHVTRGWIGVEPRELTPEIAETFNLPIQQGVLITGVLQNGPASAGGLRPGDVVTKVANTPVINVSQLLTAVATLKPQEKAVIEVQRGDKTLELNVTVGQRPKASRRRPE
jgi:Do/DeqQ family serine protease